MGRDGTMEPMSTWQVVTAITGAVAFIITMTVWPLLSYIQRRRDGEIDRMQERQDEHVSTTDLLARLRKSGVAVYSIGLDDAKLSRSSSVLARYGPASGG